MVRLHKNTVYKEVSIEDFTPKVLKCSLYSEGRNKPKGLRLGERYVYDYEIEYFTYGAGAMIIEGKTYQVKEGDIVLRKPGQLVEGIMPYCCYLICFDLLGSTGKDPANYDFMKTELQTHYINTLLDSIPDVYHPIHGEKYHYIFDSILKEYINPGFGSTLIMKSDMLKILYEVHRDLNSIDLTGQSVPSTPHQKKIRKSIDYIKTNYTKRILLEEIAEVAELSPTYFHKLFTDLMKTTPKDYINKIRLDKARELLVKTDLPVYEIALSSGFENIPYFSYVFKNNCGISPLEFRKKHSYI